ncbi:MAG: hypothetical protein M3O32_07105 [Actinomycetota bacterium]|nr:hypothetical protein [Actinomycetota bacterium]
MTHFTLPQPGHVASDLRDAFAERLADLSVPLNDATLARLAGLLWNCTDVMPSGLCEDLELPAGSSYAQAARKLRRKRR